MPENQPQTLPQPDPTLHAAATPTPQPPAESAPAPALVTTAATPSADEGDTPALRPCSAFFDTRQLLAFATLAKTGSFTQAARELHVSQSAVSHSIGDLERKVGCRLFERTSRRVLLTLAGEQLLHHAGRISAEMAAAHESLQSLRSWGQIQLRITAPATICDGLLPHCLHQVRRNYPTARISISVADRRESLIELGEGRVDVAVCPGVEPDERFDRIPLFQDEMVFVMSPVHPWATRPPVDPAVIGVEPLLTYRRNTYTWQLIQSHLAAEGIQPTVALDCDSVITIREMARLGMGVAVLARWAVASEVASGILAWAPLGRRPLFRKWAAFTLRTRRLSLAQTLFIENLRHTALERLTSPAGPAASPHTPPSPTPTPSPSPSPVAPFSSDPLRPEPSPFAGPPGFTRNDPPPAASRLPVRSSIR